MVIKVVNRLLILSHLSSLLAFAIASTLLRRASSDEFVDLVVELLHLRDGSVFLKEDLIHVRLRVVVVSNIPIVDGLG